MKMIGEDRFHIIQIQSHNTTPWAMQYTRYNMYVMVQQRMYYIYIQTCALQGMKLTFLATHKLLRVVLI